MAAAPGAVYTPIPPENVAAYEVLFQEYKALHDYFGRGTNNVMHRLKAIQRAAIHGSGQQGSATQSGTLEGATA